MRKSEGLLFLGMGFFVLWLLIAIVYPWAGFALALVAFVTLVGFMLFVFMCFVMTRRGLRA